MPQPPTFYASISPTRLAPLLPLDEKGSPMSEEDDSPMLETNQNIHNAPMNKLTEPSNQNCAMNLKVIDVAEADPSHKQIAENSIVSSDENGLGDSKDSKKWSPQMPKKIVTTLARYEKGSVEGDGPLLSPVGKVSLMGLDEEEINLLETLGSVERERDHYLESFSAYKSQNAFLHRQIFEMSQASDVMKQREERLLS